MRRILLAEDDSALRVLYGLWIDSAGDEAVAAADGREAIGLLERGPLPDAAVLDVEMPFVDGLSVCRYLHARAPGVPIVIVSGSGDVRAAALAAGASAVLAKPCRRNELLAALGTRAVLRAAS